MIKQPISYSVTIITLSIFLLSSCATEKNFVKFHNKSDSTSAKYCILWFPVKDSVSVSNQFKKGKSDTIKGADVLIYVDCDSAYKSAYDEAIAEGQKNTKIVIQKIPVKTTPLIIKEVDTVLRDSAVFQESGAKIAIATDRINALQRQYVKIQDNEAKQEATTSKWRKGALWGWGIIALYVVYLIIKTYFTWKKNIIRNAGKLIS